MHNITDRLVTEKLVAAVQTVEKLIWALRIAIWSSTNRGELDEYLTWKSRPGARLLTEKRKVRRREWNGNGEREMDEGGEESLLDNIVAEPIAIIYFE